MIYGCLPNCTEAQDWSPEKSKNHISSKRMSLCVWLYHCHCVSCKSALFVDSNLHIVPFNEIILNTPMLTADYFHSVRFKCLHWSVHLWSDNLCVFQFTRCQQFYIHFVLQICMQHHDHTAH